MTRWAWEIKNREKVLSYQRKWRLKNKNKTSKYQKTYKPCGFINKKEYMKLWREKNKDRLQQYHAKYGRKYYSEHRLERLEYAEKYRIKNPEKVKEFRKRWLRNNPGITALTSANNRVRRKFLMNGNKILKSEWDALKNNYKFLCAYCDRREPLGMDHNIPLSRGGEHNISNILPACRSCNSKKHTKTAAEFMPERYCLGVN